MHPASSQCRLVIAYYAIVNLYQWEPTATLILEDAKDILFWQENDLFILFRMYLDANRDMMAEFLSLSGKGLAPVRRYGIKGRAGQNRVMTWFQFPL